MLDAVKLFFEDEHEVFICYNFFFSKFFGKMGRQVGWMKMNNPVYVLKRSGFFFLISGILFRAAIMLQHLYVTKSFPEKDFSFPVEFNQEFSFPVKFN